MEEAFDWLFKQAVAHAYLDGAPRATVGPTFTKQDLEEVNRLVCWIATSLDVGIKFEILRFDFSAVSRPLVFGQCQDACAQRRLRTAGARQSRSAVAGRRTCIGDGGHFALTCAQNTTASHHSLHAGVYKPRVQSSRRHRT